MSQNEGNKRFIMAITVVATLGGLLFGYDTAVISGAVKSLQAFFIDSLYESAETAVQVVVQFRVVVSLVVFVLLAAISGLLLKMFGRMKGGIISIILLIAAAVLLIFTFNAPPELN